MMIFLRNKHRSETSGRKEEDDIASYLFFKLYLMLCHLEKILLCFSFSTQWNVVHKQLFTLIVVSHTNNGLQQHITSKLFTSTNIKGLQGFFQV